MANRRVNQYREVAGWLARVFPTSYLEVMTEARLKQQIKGVYHERQRGRHEACLTCALNNLLQGKRPFTRKELAKIAAEINFWFGPTEHPTGPWMSCCWWLYIIINIISMRHRTFGSTLFVAALGTRDDKMVDCYDPSRVEMLPFMLVPHGQRLVGILLNSQRPASKCRHWVAMRKVGEHWYNLDSLLDDPRILPAGEEDLQMEMQSALRNSGQVLIVSDRVKPLDLPASSSFNDLF